MSLSLEQLREEVLALPVDQRLELAESLWASLRGTAYELPADWILNLRSRVDEIRNLQA